MQTTTPIPPLSCEPPNRKRVVFAIRILAVGGLFIFAFRAQLHELVTMAVASSDWCHICIAPLLAAELIRRRGNTIRAAAIDGSNRGLLLLVAVIVLGIVATAAGAVRYFYLLIPLGGVVGVVAATLGFRAVLPFFPAIVLLWMSVPMQERPLDILTLDVQKYSLRASTMCLDALPDTEASVVNAYIALRHNGRKSAVGLTERRFGARQIPACLTLGWFLIFLRPRPGWCVFLALASTPIWLFAANCTRIVSRAAITLYGEFDMTSSVPRTISLICSLLLMYVLTAGALYLLDCLLGEGENEDDRNAEDPFASAE